MTAGFAEISVDTQLNQVGAQVISMIEGRQPIELRVLVRDLRAEGVPDDLARIAILYLVDHDMIELTPDFRLFKASKESSK